MSSKHKGLKSASLWSSITGPIPLIDPYNNSTLGVWSPPWMSPWCPSCHAYTRPMEVRDIFADYRLLLPIQPAKLSNALMLMDEAGEEDALLGSSKVSPSNVRTKQRRLQRLQQRETRWQNSSDQMHKKTQN